MRYAPPGSVSAAVAVCLCVTFIPLHASAQCRPKQVRKGERTLRTLSCAQAEFPPGPPGPPGPQGPPGPSGLSNLAYVDGAINLFAGSFDCAAAQCAPGDRIVNCDSANINPASDNVDPATFLIGAIGFRDPEDDTPANLLTADTCIVCFANYNDFATVQILARAVCAVGAKAASAANSVAAKEPPSRIGYPEFRELSGHLTLRALPRAD